MIKNMLYKMVGIRPLSKEEIRRSLRQEKNIYDGAIFSFNFIVDRNGQLFIEGNWIESSENMADVIAQFFFMLNKGDVRPHIFNYLQGIKQKIGLPQQKFIDTILLKWSKLIENNNEIEDSPVVQPSRAFVFNQLKQQNQTINLDEE